MAILAIYVSPLVFQGSVGSIRLFLYKRTTELAGSSTAAINPVFGGAGVVLLLGSFGFFWVLLVFFWRSSGVFFWFLLFFVVSHI